MESLYLLAFLIGFAVLLAVISHLRFRKDPPEKVSTCNHFFRSIAAPYARQCRKCGLTMFREDANGNFPDGFREYFEYILEVNKKGWKHADYHPDRHDNDSH